MPETQKRAALYIRVSTDEQARHGYSLAEQEHDLRQYADRNGYDAIGVYADEGATARKALSRRKGLQRLLADVQAKKIDIILFKCLDRWFRSVRDYYKVQEILDQHNVLWECTQEEYSTTTTNGRLMLNLKLSIAQHESDQTWDRIKYVLEGHLREGRAISGRFPAGYCLSKDKRICIDKSKVPMIQEMFHYFLVNRNTTGTRKMLKAKYGFSKSLSTIARMLKSRIYIGECYGIKNFCPAMIDEDTFARAQNVFKWRTRYPRSGNIYLFTGLLRCPLCGRTLGVNSKETNGTLYIYYRCQLYTRGDCNYSRQFREERIEAALLSVIDAELRQYAAAIKDAPCDPQEDDSAQTIEGLRAKQARLKELYVEGLIPREDFDQRYRDMDMQISALRPIRDARPTFLDFANTESFLSHYHSLDRQGKKEFWANTVDHIRVLKKGLRPVFRVT